MKSINQSIKLFYIILFQSAVFKMQEKEEERRAVAAAAEHTNRYYAQERDKQKMEALERTKERQAERLRREKEIKEREERPLRELKEKDFQQRSQQWQEIVDNVGHNGEDVHLDTSRTLRVSWSPPSYDTGCYSDKGLREIFSKHGRLRGVAVCSVLKGRAVVEYDEIYDAMGAVSLERGLTHKPITVTFFSKPICVAAARSGNRQIERILRTWARKHCEIQERRKLEDELAAKQACLLSFVSESKSAISS
jgi:flagellar biosynthesis GTPase FlhF